VTAAPADVDPLAPVRTALLGHARSDAARVLAAADHDVAVLLDDAAAEATRIREAASAETAAYARTLAATQRSHARREGRAIVLRAQQDAYVEGRRRAHEAVRSLCDAPDYPDLLSRLTARARADLGPGATVRPHPDGGVVAELGSRRVSYTLTALADRVLDDLLAGRDA
jgi:vacuolar-type H+-ATPase subunit E/Vma4